MAGLQLLSNDMATLYAQGAEPREPSVEAQDTVLSAAEELRHLEKPVSDTQALLDVLNRSLGEAAKKLPVETGASRAEAIQAPGVDAA